MKFEILDFIKNDEGFLVTVKTNESSLFSNDENEKGIIFHGEKIINSKEVYKSVIGYELISINKEYNNHENLINIKKNIAFTWHENLLNILSEFANIKLNLKYISNGGRLNCKLFITILDNNNSELQKITDQIKKETSTFFPSILSDKISPYLFQELNNSNLLEQNNSEEYCHLFYREPITISFNNMSFGFNSVSDTNDNNLTLYLPFYSQPLEYDYELFKAMLNQNEYTELDIQLIPFTLTENEIRILNDITKKINSGINMKMTFEEINKISNNLQSFLNTKFKYFVTVAIRSKYSIISEHIKTGIKNYFFGKNVNVHHLKINNTQKILDINNDTSHISKFFPFYFSLPDVLQVFRLPFPDNITFPGFNQKSPGFFTLPGNLDDNGILIGEKKINNKKKQIRISSHSISKHIFVSGQTGTGKSTLLKTMIIDCAKKKYGFTLIDPHGDLFDEVISIIPDDSKDRLKVINVTRPADSFGINPLAYNKNLPQGKSLVINELMRIFASIYDLKIVGGPMFESFFKNGLLLIMDEAVEEKYVRLSIIDFVNVFTNEDYRSDLLRSCKNNSVVNFFTTSNRMSGDYSFANFALYITSKLTRFADDFYLTPILTSENSLDFRNLIDNDGILLIKLDKGLIGTDNTSLLGQIIISQIYLAGLSRTTINKEARKPHHIFIDEFQNFVRSDIGSALSEVRKYGLNLILANQTLGQLDQHLVYSIFGNVGSMILFRPGITDYEIIKHYFYPEFSRAEILNLPNFHCIGRLLIDNIPSDPFIFETIK